MSSQVLTAAILSQSFFFVPSNDFPETFRGGQTCCPVVVGVGDAGMGMMQKRAGEIGVLAAANSGAGEAAAVRNICELTATPTVARVVTFITSRHLFGGYGRGLALRRAKGPGVGLSGRASTGLCWLR